MRSDQPKLMTEGSVWKHLLTFAIPVFIGYLFQQMYNTVDSLIVGNFVSHKALAAVTSTGSVTYLLVGFFMGFSAGAGIVIAQALGEGNREAVSRSVHTSVAMGLAFSVLMTLVGVLACEPILRLMGTPEDVLPDAVLYLRIYFGGMTGLIMYNTFTGILRAGGDSTHPLFYLIFSSLLNLALDLLFIAALGMGVEGAALATVISQLASALLALARLARMKSELRISFSLIRFDPVCLRRIVSYGFPTALQSCVIDLSNVLIQSYINSFGSLAMAGMGAYSKVEGFVFLPVTSFTMAVSTFIPQNLGAGRRDRVLRGSRFSILSATLFAEAFGLLYFLLAPTLISAFNADPQVIAFGAKRAVICSLFYGLLAFSHMASAVVRSVGKPVVPMAVMLICWCAVRVLVISTLGQVWHVIELACWIYPFTWSLSTVVYLFYLHRLRRAGVL